jgi:tetratricopeptide (TPR) repeat protein
LKRIFEAGGKFDEAANLETKIKSLRNLSGTKQPPQKKPKEPEPESEPEYFSGQASDEPEFGEVSFADVDTEIAAHERLQAADAATDDGIVVADEMESSEGDVEIEVDFDDDSDLEIPLDAEETAAPEEDWLAAVEKMLDKIATKKGKVKFASDLDGEDAQSHYDLGMAFMEMGLYDESFKEFRQAAADISRRFVCFVFQGVCLREKGDLENAEKVLRHMSRPGLSLEDSCTAMYELALTCQAAGKPDEYVTLLTEIDATDRNFRDVRMRLDAVNIDRDALDFSDDDFKIFDVK